MYMTIKGSNAFAWGHKDVHATLNEDILMEPVLPEPVNSRGIEENFFFKSPPTDGCGLIFIIKKLYFSSHGTKILNRTQGRGREAPGCVE
jgi:hypothetical protein